MQITIEAVLSGMWCEAEAIHQTDADGQYTAIYVSTHDGLPMWETWLDGHISLPAVHAVIEDLASGRPSLASWHDLRRSTVA